MAHTHTHTHTHITTDHVWEFKFISMMEQCLYNVQGKDINDLKSPSVLLCGRGGGGGGLSVLALFILLPMVLHRQLGCVYTYSMAACKEIAHTQLYSSTASVPSGKYS